MLPFLTYAKDRKLREELYTAYLNRCNHDDANDNKALVNDFIRLRTEKAHLLGYDTYADYVISEQMARTPKAVYALLDEIWTPALDRAKEELAEMEKLFKADEPEGTFESWDWWYYAEKVRRRDYSLDDEAVRPYFTLDNVQGGIFFLANRLYGITFRPIVAPLYHPDCRVYEVLDEDESHLGVIYFDYYVREGKSGGAWCGNFTEQTYENGERVAPVVGVVTNYARPTRNAPTLLNIDETKTLFHEFGHALHDLFRKVEYRGLSDVEGDFVELPSQVMENWAMEPEMLEQYALHYRTSDRIPTSLMQKIKRSAQFNQGFEMTELLAAALSDLDIHSIKEYEPLDVNAFEREGADSADRTPLPLSLFQPHLRRRIFGRILLLHLGAGARQGCLCGLQRDGRHLQQKGGARLPREAPCTGRRGRRHDALPCVPGCGSRQNGAAQGRRILEGAGGFAADGLRRRAAAPRDERVLEKTCAGNARQIRKPQITHSQ